MKQFSAVKGMLNKFALFSWSPWCPVMWLSEVVFSSFNEEMANYRPLLAELADCPVTDKITVHGAAAAQWKANFKSLLCLLYTPAAHTLLISSCCVCHAVFTSYYYIVQCF